MSADAEKGGAARSEQRGPETTTSANDNGAAGETSESTATANPDKSHDKSSDTTQDRDGGARHAGKGDEEGKADSAETSDNAQAGGATFGRNKATSLGSAMEREEAAEEARNVFGGDSVGRDKNIFYIGAERQFRLCRISPDLLEPVQHAFEPPQHGWPELAAGFERRRTTLFRAADGRGKQALAIKLLLNAKHQRIYDIPQGADLTQLALAIESDALTRNAGFIMECSASEQLPSGRALRNMDFALQTAGARLVIIAGLDLSIADHDLQDYDVRPPLPPPSAKVLERHIRWHFGGAYASDQILAQKDLAEALKELLRADMPLRVVAKLALIIKQSTTSDRTDVKRVRTLMLRNSASDFTIWLDGFDLEDRCFAAALAVLNHMPYRTVAQAARTLRDRINAGLSKTPPPRLDGPRTAALSWRERLADFRARDADVYSRSTFGRVTTPAVEYADGSYPARVTLHFWDREEVAFTEWLKSLAADPAMPVKVRIRASYAFGLLATKDFAAVFDGIFRTWAASTDILQREAVAWALREPAQTPSLHGNVLALVDEWHNSREPLHKATAARAYGAGFLTDDAGIALDRLGRLSVSADYDVAVAVATSLSDLTVRNGCSLAPTVLAELCAWLPNYRREAAAQTAFLFSVRTSRVEMSRRAGSDEVYYWPTLLLLADRDESLRDSVATLWSWFYRSWLMGPEPEWVLTMWAGLAEADPRMRRVLAFLITAMARSDPRTEKRLRDLVRRWADPDHLRAVPATARVVSDHLESSLEGQL
jgi:hypothetical protein